MADLNAKICSVEGCNKKHFGKGYCEKHYTQIRRHGKILDRTRHDPNEIIDRGNHVVMFLYDMKQEKIAETQIDQEDTDLVKNHKWCLSSNKDIVTETDNGRLALHRLLAGAKSTDEVDHIDRDRLNNRKMNLRVCNHSENSRNLSRRKDNTSGFSGVIWDKRNKRWNARIQYNGKGIYLGNFIDIDQAKECRLAAEKEYFGEYAPRR